MSLVGVVAIGRNEGARLVRCLRSLVVQGPHDRVVYVDSGSEDDSVSAARDIGVQVVELDWTVPFTAARGRNAGFDHLIKVHPNLDFVQFVDGDCELVAGWLETAVDFLKDHQHVAAVCGRRRERFPEKSVYNWLCDQEWATPVGEANTCGGDAMFRVMPFKDVGGFRTNVMAGEEPELCLRLRERGWKIWRIDAEMTVHDANMTRFAQWWRRTARGGHAYAEVSELHKSSPMRIWERERNRIILWAVVLPLIIVLGGLLVNKWLFLGLLIYPAQIIRVALRRGAGLIDSWSYATFMLLAKFAELQGLTRYYRKYLTSSEAA